MISVFRIFLLIFRISTMTFIEYIHLTPIIRSKCKIGGNCALQKRLFYFSRLRFFFCVRRKRFHSFASTFHFGSVVFNCISLTFWRNEIWDSSRIEEKSTHKWRERDTAYGRELNKNHCSQKRSIFFSMGFDSLLHVNSAGMFPLKYSILIGDSKNECECECAQLPWIWTCNFASFSSPCIHFNGRMRKKQNQKSIVSYVCLHSVCAQIHSEHRNIKCWKRLLWISVNRENNGFTCKNWTFSQKKIADFSSKTISILLRTGSVCVEQSYQMTIWGCVRWLHQSECKAHKTSWTKEPKLHIGPEQRTE